MAQYCNRLSADCFQYSSACLLELRRHLGWCSHLNVPNAAHELQTQLSQLWQAVWALNWLEVSSGRHDTGHRSITLPHNSCPCQHENCGLPWALTGT